MSICLLGMDSKVKSASIRIHVSDDHSLIRLANGLPWTALEEIALRDLKRTPKGFWWRGPRLILRLHLAAYILQARFDMTDRQMEEELRFNAAFQVFCGCTIIRGWHAIDHTSICKFRLRLKPETARAILIEVVKTAEALGFADPSWMDVDSTVQEANISYPSDANLMLKLAKDGEKLRQWLKDHIKFLPDRILPHALGEISAKAKEYFFLSKKTAIEKKREVFAGLHRLVKKNTYELIDVFNQLNHQELKQMPSRLHRLKDRILENGRRYLLDVAHFIRTGNIKEGKILSFHAAAVACIPKGKSGKPFEFGRVFQLGRIGGNFLIPLACSAVRLEDKHSLLPMIEEHAFIFGAGRLDSIGADKGYYSHKNVLGAFERGVTEIGLQKPGVTDSALSLEHEMMAKRLRDRRAGIEPLIGHAKRFGLAKSRMKSDMATLASGYRSILGFNLRQIERHQEGLMKKTA